MDIIISILAILLVFVSFFGDYFVKWYYERKGKGD